MLGLEHAPRSSAMLDSAASFALVLVVGAETLRNGGEAAWSTPVVDVTSDVGVSGILELLAVAVKSGSPVKPRAPFQASASTQVSQERTLCVL